MQFFVSLALAGGVLAYLLWSPGQHAPPDADVLPPTPQSVQVLAPGQIRIEPESALANKLDIATVEASRVDTPALRVTGTVTASLRPAPAGGEFWQFDNPEVLAIFYDWQRSQVDIAFAEAQENRIRELADTRIGAQRKIVERMERLVRAGTDTLADLEVSRAELMEREIDARQQIHEAETDVRRAQQDEAVLVRQLQLAGLEPEMLAEATSDVDIVVADVPEESIGRVRIGQKCEARFFGAPKQVFPGVVRSIAPVVSPERRSLRVLFFVDDPDDQLRPGMFAEIGLGTDERDTLLVPAESLIHVGRADYLLVADDMQSDAWRVAEVEAGDLVNGQIEIFSGVGAGDRVIGRGAILLKPVASASLQYFGEEQFRPLPRAVDEVQP